MIVIPEPVIFEWDKGNAKKNLRGHGVSDNECEEAFSDEKKVTFTDVVHSGLEERLRVIGKTNSGRMLFVVFTIRDNSVRIISA